MHDKEKALEKEKSHLHEVETKLHTKEEMLRLNQEEDERIVIMQLENDIADLKQQLEAKKAKKKNVKESKAKLERENKESSRRITSLESQVHPYFNAVTYSCRLRLLKARSKRHKIKLKSSIRNHVTMWMSCLLLRRTAKTSKKRLRSLGLKRTTLKYVMLERGMKLLTLMLAKA